MLPTSAKACGQYLSSLLAAQSALKQGSDEALLLDASGNIAEGPAENIFLVKDGRLVTNDESSSILLGITRESVLSIAQNLGFSVEVRHLTPEDLFHADEAFFTGTAVEIVSIREVDGKLIGTPGCHPVTDQIHGVLNRITAGLDAAYRHWLKLVSPPLRTRERRFFRSAGCGYSRNSQLKAWLDSLQWHRSALLQHGTLHCIHREQHQWARKTVRLGGEIIGIAARTVAEDPSRYSYAQRERSRLSSIHV